MAFTDTRPRTVVAASGRTRIPLSEDVRVGDLIGRDTNDWVLADGDTAGIPAQYAALEDGENGETINVAKIVTMTADYDCVAGDIGDTVYQSDTAGEVDITAGTVEIIVGQVDDIDRITLTLPLPA